MEPSEYVTHTRSHPLMSMFSISGSSTSPCSRPRPNEGVEDVLCHALLGFGVVERRPAPVRADERVQVSEDPLPRELLAVVADEIGGTRRRQVLCNQSVG